MKRTVKIRCKNNKKTVSAEIGSTLADIFPISGVEMKHGPMSAEVNNKVEGMNYRVYHNKDVEFLDVTTPSGRRAYVRTLFFVLCKAVNDLYPEGKVLIDIPVSNGYYCDLRIGRAVTLEDVTKIRQRMEEIISSAIPIRRHEVPTEEAIEVFSRISSHSSKVKLLHSIGSLYTIYYEIDGYNDYYYGTLLTNTRQLYLFGLEKYYDGLLLRIPSLDNPDVLGEMVRQDKMFEIFKEHHRWQDIIGISTVGDFNEKVREGHATDIIKVSEALQEKKIANIAEAVANSKGVKMVLIAGPSSSGKTTTCKRLSVQLMTCGLKPIQISLDDYFVNRAETPLDEKGDYDYESLYALNIPLLNEHMKRLFEGEEITLPKYDFQTGISNPAGGKKLRLEENDILVVEGIHALNPKLTEQIPDEMKYRVYASALTTILLDSHNYIPTTDNRLLRRIVRDYKYRGCSAEETIRRWASVRAGENKWIFPYQENADTMFNTAMLFELAAIKQQAEPILSAVPQNAPEHAEAYRLLKFLSYISPINDSEIPPTSLIREFLGGSSFKY
ncbi:MAG: nucleoside kinase [Prevotella sp.]|uniref:nucleoside kinase n=1 Tax=Prevotella sp. TaxID=59823 RepID=UPI002A2D1246|nr:nucleoside kinase [Prevotella sp.]MDD7317305.1 nucleoside kinase [Prevotellaceae bacterium]MDY4019909.1 nucleoside kinase [Prevotella sp.]